MTQAELTMLNIGQNLDDLMNLDPRGYGVCRILYAGARKQTGQPLSTNAAQKLVDTLHEGDIVYLFTGFVLLPHKQVETDGMIGTALLARALVRAFGVKPVIICPQESVTPMQMLGRAVGLHTFDSIEALDEYPIAMAIIPFTKDAAQAQAQGDELLKKGLPKAAISIEAPGANAKGRYHNAAGLDVTDLEAKSDLFFEQLIKMGVLNISIGDLGNEMGLGKLGDHLTRYIPKAAPGTCVCGCEGGLAVASAADHIITATVSDWGCYALIAALAFIKEDPAILHTGELEREVLLTGVRAGLVNMDGWITPALDGFEMEMNVTLVNLMRSCIEYPLKLKKSCKGWFDGTLALGFFNQPSV